MGWDGVVVYEGEQLLLILDDTPLHFKVVADDLNLRFLSTFGAGNRSSPPDFITPGIYATGRTLEEERP